MNSEMGKRPSKRVFALLLTIAVVINWQFWQHSRPKKWSLKSLLPDQQQLATFGTDSRLPKTYSITITQGGWSAQVDTIGHNFSEVAVTPLVRRVIMANDNRNRVYHLPATLAQDTSLGDSIWFIRWMIEPDETLSSAVVTYRLSDAAPGRATQVLQPTSLDAWPKNAKPNRNIPAISDLHKDYGTEGVYHWTLTLEAKDDVQINIDPGYTVEFRSDASTNDCEGFLHTLQGDLVNANSETLPFGDYLRFRLKPGRVEPVVIRFWHHKR